MSDTDTPGERPALSVKTSEGSAVIGTHVPRKEFQYRLTFDLSADEPLRNVSLMDLAGAVSEHLPGLRVDDADMRGGKNRDRKCLACDGTGQAVD